MRSVRASRAPERGTKAASRCRMNHFVANFTGWLASLLLIATATVLWGIAALIVWISGNGKTTCRAWRFGR